MSDSTANEVHSGSDHDGAPPSVPIPRRPEDGNLALIESIRGLRTKHFLTKSGLAWIRPFVRTENIDLHTTFPRKRKFFGWFSAGVSGLFTAGALVAPMFVFGWAVLIVQALLVAIPVAVGVIGSFVALPESGSLFQRIKQEIGGHAWQIDLYRALGSGVSIQARGAVILVIYALSGGIGWFLDRWLPLGVSMAAAIVVFVWMLCGFVAWLDWTMRGFGQRRSLSLPEEVHRLSMVQALSWTSLANYPGETKKRSQRPLIFVSSFNEGFDGYVGGFVEGMAGDLAGPWGEAPGFPEVSEGFRPFLEYVDRASFPLEHSFVAYPHCSVVDIRNALQLDRNYRSLRYELGGQMLTSARFDQFMARSRLALAAIPSRAQLVPKLPGDPTPQLEIPKNGNAPVPMTVEGATATNRGTTTTILLSVLPFDLKHADVVRKAIRTLPGGFADATGVYAHVDSPFMQVRGTHLARLAVVAPRTVGGDFFEAIHFEDPRVNEQPHFAWLLFSAQFDTVKEEGGVQDWLQRSHDALEQSTNGSIKAIWGKAADLIAPSVNLDNSYRWANLVLSGRHEPLIRQVDHPENTVWDVLRSLHTHRAVTGYLVDNPKVDLTTFTILDLVPFRQP